jgi:hypothetical protein
MVMTQRCCLPARTGGIQIIGVDRENATQADENGQATKENILFKNGFYWIFNPKIMPFLCVNVSFLPAIKM